MANLTESAIYEAGIYQLETTDPVLGGPSGVANTQGKQLANRTKWLKEKIDAAGYSATGATAFTGDVNLVVESGWYYVTGSSTNKPAAADGWLQVVKYSTAGYVLQIYYCSTLDLAYWRKIYDGPTYGNWIQFASQATIDDIQSQIVGMVAGYAYSSPPPGWLKCNGAAVSRATYAALFAKIGTTFGVGNGSTTFNLPDLRGEFIRGWSDGSTVDSGRASGSNQAGSQIQEHVSTDGSNLTTFILNDDGSTTYSIQGRASTGNGATLTYRRWYVRPRNVALLYCIKY